MEGSLWGMNLLAKIFQQYGVRFMGIDERKHEEKQITLSLGLYDADYELDFDEEPQFDGRLNSSVVFRTDLDVRLLRLCIFFPGSGCGVMIEEGVIAFAEDGPRGWMDSGPLGLTGKQVTVHTLDSNLFVLIVWHEEPKTIPHDELCDTLKRMHGLDMAFA